MQKNEIYEAEITGMTAEGTGVCRIGGMAVFVPMTAIGDRLNVRIVKVLKRYAFGIIAELLRPAEGRCEPDCPVFRQCGGCAFRHVTYETELQYKAQLVEDAFLRIGGIDAVYEPILGDTRRAGYRNKAQYPVTMQDNHLMCGFYARHSHRIVPTKHCLLQPALFSEVLGEMLPMLEQCGVTAYDETSHTGELRHIYFRQGYHSEEMMLCLVVRHSVRNKIGSMADRLMQKFPMIVSIVESVNPEKTNVIMGKTVTTLAGKHTIPDRIAGVEVELSPQAFYQVNTAQAEHLYAIARDYAGLHGEEVLLDLYCGAGTIGLSMADGVSRLIGVEVVPEAVENAKANAERNHAVNATFLCSDAGAASVHLQQQGLMPDVIVLDPPRKGCDETTLQAVACMQPSRIVMISCDPATAARDCAKLAASGYAVKKVRAVDLFPGTAHVECVVLMSRDKA